MNILIHYLAFLIVFWGYHFVTLNKVPTDIALWGGEDK